MTVLTIVGARPQFIKAAPLSKALRQAGVREIMVHTGQHYDNNMSQVFFQELDLPAPTVNLAVGSGSHAQQTARIMTGLDQFLDTLDTPPDHVVVFGDTNSTLAGALTAAKRHLSVVHIEAGLRSFNRNMPEETNRILTDHAANILCCTHEAAAQQLAREGIAQNVHVVGDLMRDAQLAALERTQPADAAQYLAQYQIEPGQFTLVTLHRAENTENDAVVRGIFEVLSQIQDVFLWPLHPRTRQIIEQYNVTIPQNVKMTDPLPYTVTQVVLQNARRVMTDSGGLQKDAYWLRIPCITLRNETEWTETLAGGWNQLVGTDPERILVALKVDIIRKNYVPLYGNGTAAAQIVRVLVENTNY